MKKSILFSVLVVGATLLQAQSITVHQTCGQNGQVLVIETNGHECVDLGLPSGTLWATCNVGATTPEDYGNYYAWGETATKETYYWSTYFDTNDDGNTFTKYNNNGGKFVPGQAIKRAPAAKMETYNVTIVDCEGTNWVTDIQYVMNDADGMYRFAFDIYLPTGQEDVTLGQTYTLADMDTEYTWGYCPATQEQFADFTAATFVKTMDPATGLVNITASATDADGNVYNIVYHEGAKRINIDGLYYDLYDTIHTAKVTSQNYGSPYWSTTITTANIPDSVTYNSVTYSVTSIGERAFSGCSGLTSVTIPNSVTSIGDYAFSGCSGLTSVTIPNSVTSIGSGAFQNCSGLTSVTIPNSVTSIGGWAFQNCSGLTSLLYNAHVFAYMPTSYSGAYTIPDGIESIAGGAFYNCNGLTSVTIPNSVTSIGANAFRGCSGLTSVTIPNSVTSIGNNAFDECIDLTSVTIPNSVTSIGNLAFASCSNLTSLMIEAETPPALGLWVFYNANDCPIYVPCGTIDAYTSAWPEYANRIISMPLNYQITGNVNIEGAGSVQLPQYICDSVIIAVSNYGYHFAQWSDGNTDNPRTIVLTQDTTFTAEFAKNTYTISTTSANPEWGTTAGDTAALYMDEVEISAIPNYGYHFTQWSDGNTDNPRTIVLTQDTTFTAEFAKNSYTISTTSANPEWGTTAGDTTALYLDEVEISAIPNYGYHFTKWSDGNTDNPRTIVLTQDTTFTAEFAYDRVGTCGKDLALVWSYDPNSKVLTIGNAGSFTENMQFGVEAPNEMEELVIGNSVTAIGANAFAGISSLKKVTIGESVKTIGEQAFYNCVNLETIFNYRPTPTNAYSTAFDGVDKFECVLYVLSNSINMYKNASVWRDFYYTYAIGAEGTTVTTNDVTVEPQDNAVTLTWPTSNNAATYTIEITKDSIVFCTLIFNANGQLTGIAYALDREGTYHAPAAIMTANGLQFTVTGLSSNTLYGYSLTTKDAANQVLASYSGDFTTTGGGVTTEIDNTSFLLYDGTEGTRKIIRNGRILILRGDKTYTPTGQEVK